MSPKAPRLLFLALLAGLGLGLACKNDSGSQSPGGGQGGRVTAIEGSASCPQAVPQRGAPCPRGESDFCVYRTTGGDFACVCGGGKWGCGAK